MSSPKSWTNPATSETTGSSTTRSIIGVERIRPKITPRPIVRGTIPKTRPTVTSFPPKTGICEGTEPRR